MPCHLKQNGVGLSAHVSDTIDLPIPASRTARYQPFVGGDVVLGLRPEHITEPRDGSRGGGAEFSVPLDVVEPLGMETMVFFTVNGNEVCGRVEPASAGEVGTNMRLHANMEHMHLIDPASGAVI
jgi:multiple sugar transport system ATP-binding protein